MLRSPVCLTAACSPGATSIGAQPGVKRFAEGSALMWKSAWAVIFFPPGMVATTGTWTVSPASCCRPAVSNVTRPVSASTCAFGASVENFTPSGTGWLEKSLPWCEIVAIGTALVADRPCSTEVTGYCSALSVSGPVTWTFTFSTWPAEVRTSIV